MLKERQLLEDALARHIITPEQFAQMDAMIETTVNRNPDERFRIVSGFSEVFISVGLYILLSAISGLLLAMFANKAVALVLVSGVAWMAATYFTEKRRNMLPSIVACLFCACSIGGAIWAMEMPNTNYLRALSRHQGDLFDLLPPLAASFIALAAAAWRLRIPFLMLPLGIIFAMLVTLAGREMGDNPSYRLLLAVSGLTILGIALYFDLKDPHRVRRASDFAFWCYVIGSPLTIHSMFITLLFNIKSADVLLPIFLVAVSALVSVAALMINRRALILSTLIYIGFSLGYFVKQLSGGHSIYVALIPMFLIGLYVVCLGTAWRRVRRALMVRLTPRQWFSKLPPF